MKLASIASAGLAAALVALSASPASAGDAACNATPSPCMEECMRDYREKGPGEKYGAEWALPGEKVSSKKDHQFRATLYGWLPQTTGSIKVGSAKADADTSFNDILDALKGSYSGRLTFEGERWGGYGDLFYAHLGSEFGSGAASADTDLRLKLIEGAATYRILGDRTTAQQARKPSLHLIGGVRYVSLKADLDVPPAGISATRRNSWVDPIIGIGGSLPLTKGVDLYGSFDGGGFGVGSKATWNAILGVNWHISERLHLIAGYRLLKIDYVDDSGARRVHAKLRLDGPFAGLTLWF